MTRIRKELVANKFYERYAEWQKSQEVAAWYFLKVYCDYHELYCCQVE
jgi:hypothetical protein